MNERESRRIVAERSGGLCERCGLSQRVTLHHRKKRSQGGSWAPENCGHLCGHGTAGCHGHVEAHPNEAEAEGWHVRPWSDPATTRVLYRGSWALLTDDGKVDFEEQG